MMWRSSVRGEWSLGGHGGFGFGAKGHSHRGGTVAESAGAPAEGTMRAEEQGSGLTPGKKNEMP